MRSRKYRRTTDLSATLLLFALAHKVRIKTDPGIVDEYPAADLADVYLGDLAGEKIVHGGFEVQRNAVILGKMIQCAHRQDAERDVRA
jgi:hypothetical protein